MLNSLKQWLQQDRESDISSSTPPPSRESQTPNVQQLMEDKRLLRQYDSTNASDFEDTRAKLSGDEDIRLVRIAALDSPNPVLNLEWMHVRLSDSPAYNALSYTWGEASTNPLLNLKGYRLIPNLMSCLLELMVKSPGLWWIDALCINQDDPIEKSQQVKKMRDIYARAQEVYSWLGSKSADGEPALRILARIYQITSDHAFDNQGLPFGFEDDAMERLKLPKLDDPSWDGLIKFLSRPYFERIWVLQELAVAKDSTSSIMCGHIVVPWDHLYFSIRFLVSHGWNFALLNLARERASALNLTDIDLPAFHFIDTITLLRHSLQKDPLAFYLDPCRSYRATDSRDKIIALLGLIAPGEQTIKELEPDYSQPADEYFREATGALIIHHRSYQLLSMVEARSTTDAASLPSWVPDYSERWYNPYHAGRFTPIPGTAFSAEWTSGSNILRVEASILDEILEVSPDFGSIGANINEIVLSWLSLAAGLSETDEWLWLLHAVDDPNPISEIFDSFWRTLIGNKSGQNDTQGEVINAPEDHLYLVLGSLMKTLMEKDEAKMIFVVNEWCNSPLIEEKIINSLEEGKSELYDKLVISSILYNTFFVTKGGRMGIGPSTLQKGDEVASFSGGDSLYFIRQSQGKCRFIGHGYVHTLMDGSIIENAQPSRYIDLE